MSVACGSLALLLVLLSLCGVNGLIKGKSGYERKGVALLDAVTFSKVVPHNDLGILLLIWNEGKKGDYGADSMVEDFCNFAEMAEFKGESENVLFTQLVVNNWANKNLSIQIDPTLETYDFPRIYYFHPGNERPVPYPRYTTSNQIALNRFLGSATNFYLGVPGTQKNMYHLAKEFISTETQEDMQSVLQKTIQTVERMTSEMGGTWREFGYYYVKTMQKVIESGKEHLYKEINRLEDLVSDQSKRISIEKRQELQGRVNILHNFMTLEALGIGPDSKSSYGKTPEELEKQQEEEEEEAEKKVGMMEL